MGTSTITQIARSTPALLSDVAARMIGADAGIACSPSTCSDSAGPIPFSELADAATIPGYGAEYKGWGISSALDEATVSLPDDYTTLTLSAPAGGLHHLGERQGGRQGRDERRQRFRGRRLPGRHRAGRILAPVAGWRQKGLSAAYEQSPDVDAGTSEAELGACTAGKTTGAAVAMMLEVAAMQPAAAIRRRSQEPGAARAWGFAAKGEVQDNVGPPAFGSRVPAVPPAHNGPVSGTRRALAALLVQPRFLRRGASVDFG